MLGIPRTKDRSNSSDTVLGRPSFQKVALTEVRAMVCIEFVLWLQPQPYFACWECSNQCLRIGLIPQTWFWVPQPYFACWECPKRCLRIGPIPQTWFWVARSANKSPSLQWEVWFLLNSCSGCSHSHILLVGNAQNDV